MFGRRKKIEVVTPVAGPLVAMAEVPDPVFSNKSMGDGFAVDPTEGRFCSPVDGELFLVAKTLHAFAVRAANGAEFLVHVGIDTVKLKGAGFRGLKQAGCTVTAGEPIIECDLEAVRAQVPSMLTPVILSNGAAMEILDLDLQAAPGAPVMTVRKR